MPAIPFSSSLPSSPISPNSSIWRNSSLSSPSSPRLLSEFTFCFFDCLGDTGDPPYEVPRLIFFATVDANISVSGHSSLSSPEGATFTFCFFETLGDRVEPRLVAFTGDGDPYEVPLLVVFSGDDAGDPYEVPRLVFDAFDTSVDANIDIPSTLLRILDLSGDDKLTEASRSPPFFDF
ncbi:hypothetical protein YC2023_038075 [Brassica napus]